MASELIDNKLQWHDLLNPVGMGAYVLGKASDIVNDLNGVNSANAVEHAEEREDTTYQRAITDMQSAGLNPALLATGQAQGAPSYASAQTVSNSASNTQSKTNLITSALMLMLASKGMIGTVPYHGTKFGFK